MSQKVEIPLDTQCYLCDSYYSQAHLVFVVYKCFLCMKYTPYCMACELQLQRLFGKGNFFKCMICDKLTNALDKIEVCPCSINDISNSSIININNKNYINNTIINIIVSPFRKDGHDYSLLANRSRLNKRLGLNDTLSGRKRDDSENNIKLNRTNRSRGKFKNLISMKMSKVYKKDNNEDREISTNNNESMNNGIKRD